MQSFTGKMKTKSDRIPVLINEDQEHIISKKTIQHQDQDTPLIDEEAE